MSPEVPVIKIAHYLKTMQICPTQLEKMQANELFIQTRLNTNLQASWKCVRDTLLGERVAQAGGFWTPTLPHSVSTDSFID